MTLGVLWVRFVHDWYRIPIRLMDLPLDLMGINHLDHCIGSVRILEKLS